MPEPQTPTTSGKQVDTSAASPSLQGGTSVTLAIDGAIALITLNRPDAYNAIDASMTEGLAAAMAEVESADAIRVIVLNGAGKGFCSGGDLNFFASRGDDLRGSVDRLLGQGHRFLQALRDTRKLVLVSVHGAAAGAGLSLAAAGDFCIAASDAVFVSGYAKLGVSPDMGGTANMTRAVGLRRAMRVFFLDDRLSAGEAERLGIVSRVVAPELLAEETHKLAQALAAIPAQAAVSTKLLLQRAASTPLAEQLEAELEFFQTCVLTPVTQAALQRFADKAPSPTEQERT
jgi:enoyl-CoA hydratase/carnithine racemase